jgi:hypothetical protein
MFTDIDAYTEFSGAQNALGYKQYAINRPQACIQLTKYSQAKPNQG